MRLDNDFLATIIGVCAEASGRTYPDLEQIQDWCAQWLYKQDGLEIADADVQQLIDNCELTEDQAKRQAAVDTAYLAWLESLDYEPSGADAVTMSALTL
jgi:hypothetical protein